MCIRDRRKEKTEAITDAGHKAKVGQVQDLSDVQEYNDLLKREQEMCIRDRTSSAWAW